MFGIAVDFISKMFRYEHPHQSRASTRICAVGAFTFVGQDARVDMQCVMNTRTMKNRRVFIKTRRFFNDIRSL